MRQGEKATVTWVPGGAVVCALGFIAIKFVDYTLRSSAVIIRRSTVGSPEGRGLDRGEDTARLLAFGRPGLRVRNQGGLSVFGLLDDLTFVAVKLLIVVVVAGSPPGTWRFQAVGLDLGHDGCERLPGQVDVTFYRFIVSGDAGCASQECRGAGYVGNESLLRR